MYEKVLYATDLLPETECVAERAKQLADFHKAELYMIHVVENLPAIYASPMVFDVESTIYQEAKKGMKELAKNIGVDFEKNCKVELGSIKEEALNYAKSINCDLIVVGSHTKHGLAFILGSNANSLLDISPCDVLAIKTEVDK